MSSVFLHGDNPQLRFEKKLAAFLQAEDGIVCQSGWNANVGLIQSLAQPGIPVYLDMMAHASLWEGVRSAEARAVPFMHNDVEHLQRQLGKYGPGIVVVDSVYSTNGSLCPLFDIVEAAEHMGSVIVVDESHSLGTHGPQGAGLVVELDLQDRVHFRTASLAKAFAGRAGFITCSTRFKGYFLTESRPAIFSSCLLNHELAWFDAAVDFIRQADDRRQCLHQNARRLRAGLAELGLNVGDGSEQIIALEAGTEPQTLALRKALDREGVIGSVFCAPATPKNRSLVRLSISAKLSDDEIQKILIACQNMQQQVDWKNWSSTRRMQRRQRVA